MGGCGTIHFQKLSNHGLEFIEGLPPVMQEFSPFVQNMRDVVCNNNPSAAALAPE